MEKVTFEPCWVESARAGDQDALTGLYTSTYHDVYLTIKMLLRQDEDTVMDLLQDTYIKAFLKKERYIMQNCHLFVYLFSIMVINKSINK